MPDTPDPRETTKKYHDETNDSWLGHKPTMPDTLSREEIEQIRKRVAAANNAGMPYATEARLLAHIDALTAAVEALPTTTPVEIGSDWPGKREHKYPEYIDRAAVLAILRGES